MRCTGRHMVGVPIMPLGTFRCVCRQESVILCLPWDS